MAAALLAMAWVPGASSAPLPLVGLWGLAFAAYALAARSAESISPRTIWAGGVVVRLGLVGAAPVLSEDVYRYIWDGWVARNGTNPFAYPPAAGELTAIRTDWWELINHPTVSTIYPPGAQALFLGLAWIAPSVLLFKLAWLAADLLVAWLTSRLSPEGSTLPLLLWLWSPLVIVEVAWSGHFEPVGIAVMLAAVFVARTRGWAGGALLGFGASIKFAPLAAVPALFRRHGAVAAGLAVLVPAVLYLPYAGAGARLFEGLRTYADVWQFNAGLFTLLDALPSAFGLDLGRIVGALAVGGVALFAAARRWELDRTLFLTIGTALALSPTIHPWYVLWVLPFACLSGSRAWLLFSGTVFFAYAGRDAYLATGTWPEPIWLRVLIHAPLLALLVRERGAADTGA
jgi:hypothetical protein